MNISDYQGSSGVSATSSPLTSSNLTNGVDFFKLLSAQMASQDPMSPVDNTQFMSQLAQYSQLQQSVQTNQNLGTLAALQESLSALQTMTQSASLISKQVDYIDPSSGEAKSGQVNAVRVDNGLVVLDVSGANVPLTNVTAITAGS